MADIKKYQMQSVDKETGDVKKIIHPESQSDVIEYSDSTPINSPNGGTAENKTYDNSNVYQVLYDILHNYLKPVLALPVDSNGAPIKGVTGQLP